MKECEVEFFDPGVEVEVLTNVEIAGSTEAVVILASHDEEGALAWAFVSVDPGLVTTVLVAHRESTDLATTAIDLAEKLTSKVPDFLAQTELCNNLVYDGNLGVHSKRVCNGFPRTRVGSVPPFLEEIEARRQAAGSGRDCRSRTGPHRIDRAELPSGVVWIEDEELAVVISGLDDADGSNEQDDQRRSNFLTLWDQLGDPEWFGSDLLEAEGPWVPELIALEVSQYPPRESEPAIDWPLDRSVLDMASDEIIKGEYEWFSVGNRLIAPN